jgi:hypothetical protein
MKAQQSRLERLIDRRAEIERSIHKITYWADQEIASLQASLDIVNQAIKEEADVYALPVARERISAYECRIGGYDSNDIGE